MSDEVQIFAPNLLPYDKDNGQAGMLAPTGLGWNPSIGLAVTANVGYFARFVPSRAMTIVSMACAISTASAGNVDLGIYNAALTSRLASTGAVAGQLGTTGVKPIALTASLVLVPGTVYYAAFSCASTPNPVATTYGSSFGSQFFGATAGLFEAATRAASHPLPADASSAAAGSNSIVLALKET